MKSFTDELGMTGHLTIIKRYKDGEEEVVFDDHNIIVSGMGVGLAYMFTGSGSNTVLDYQIDRFKVGVSGPPAGGTTSAVYELSGPLTSLAEYGTATNLFIEECDQIVNGSVVSTNKFFALIGANKITKIGDSSVRYTLVVDEESCNNLVGAESEEVSLSEVGLFMKNPTGSNDDVSILVCYRTFSNIRKTDDFSLIFRWTLNF